MVICNLKSQVQYQRMGRSLQLLPSNLRELCSLSILCNGKGAQICSVKATKRQCNGGGGRNGTRRAHSDGEAKRMGKFG